MSTGLTPPSSSRTFSQASDVHQNDTPLPIPGQANQPGQLVVRSGMPPGTRVDRGRGRWLARLVGGRRGANRLDWTRLPTPLWACATAYLSRADRSSAQRVSTTVNAGVSFAVRRELRQHYFGTGPTPHGMTPEVFARGQTRAYLDGVPSDQLMRAGPMSAMARLMAYPPEEEADRLLPGRRHHGAPTVTPEQIRWLRSHEFHKDPYSWGDTPLAKIKDLLRKRHCMDKDSQERVAKGHINFVCRRSTVAGMGDLYFAHLNGGEVIAFERADEGGAPTFRDLSPPLRDIVGPVRELVDFYSGFLAVGLGGRLVAAAVHKSAGSQRAGVALTQWSWPWGDVRVSRLHYQRCFVSLEDGRVFSVWRMDVPDTDREPHYFRSSQVLLDGRRIRMLPQFGILALLDDGHIVSLSEWSDVDGTISPEPAKGPRADVLNNPDMYFHFLQSFVSEQGEVAIGQSRSNQDEWVLLVNRRPVPLPVPWSAKDITAVRWMDPGFVFALGQHHLFCWGEACGDAGKLFDTRDVGLLPYGALEAAAANPVHRDPAGAVLARSRALHLQPVKPVRPDALRTVVGEFRGRYSTAALSKRGVVLTVKGLDAQHSAACRNARLHVPPGAQAEIRNVRGVPTKCLPCKADRPIEGLEYDFEPAQSATDKVTYWIPKSLLKPQG